MAKISPSDQPIQELKHDAEPGYPMAFTIAFAAMTLYLAWILYSSPGQAEKKYNKKAKAEKYEDKKKSK